MHQYESVDIHYDHSEVPSIFLCDPEGSEENPDKDTQIDIILGRLVCTFMLSPDQLKELGEGISSRLDILYLDMEGNNGHY